MQINFLLSTEPKLGKTKCIAKLILVIELNHQKLIKKENMTPKKVMKIFMNLKIWDENK